MSSVQFLMYDLPEFNVDLTLEFSYFTLYVLQPLIIFVLAFEQLGQLDSLDMFNLLHDSVNFKINLFLELQFYL